MQHDRPRLAGQPPAKALKAVRYSYHWENAWKYVIVRPPVKSVGLALDTFSNRRGLQVHPGIRRIMAITGHAKPTVIEAIAEMRWLGFLWRASCSQGTNSGMADAYQLCLPRDMTHVPMIDAKTANEPSYESLPLLAQRVAVALEVDKRLKKVSGCPGQPGGSPGQPLVVVPDNLEWWSQLTPPTHLPKHSTQSTHHHSDSAESAPRTSSRGRDYDLTNDDDRYDYVMDSLDDDLDPYEASAVDGMLMKENMHPRRIVNWVLRQRREAA